MTSPSTPNKKPWYKTRKGIIIIVLVVIVLFVIGACNSADDSENSATEATDSTPTSAEEVPSEEATSAEETSAEEAPESTSSEASSDQVMPWTRHEMCQPDDGTASMIPGVLNDSSQTIANAQLIKDGDDTWIGVSLIGADGEIDSRSDVWLLQDGGLFSVSGGARNESWAVEHPDPSYNMANEYAQGVDRCVVAESTGR